MQIPIATLLLLGVCLVSVGLAMGLLIWGASLQPVERRFLLRITARADHGHGLFTLTLRRSWHERWRSLPAFVAGQSVAIALPDQPVRRRYSLARWQARPFAYELTIKREEQGKLSRLLADKAGRGAWLSVERPSGEFVLPATAVVPRAVMIAGGVGITPLLAMIDQWQHRAGPFREVHLYWQVRFETEWVHRDALERHAGKNPRLRVHWLASRPAHGTAERISAERLERDLGGLGQTHYFLCAGQSLLDTLVAGLVERGVSAEAVHYERFGLQPAGGANGEWNLQLDGQSARFAGHVSLLDALEAHGISIASDCRTGTCGQCRLTLLAGDAQHFTKPECALPPGQVVACCAIPCSDLRLTGPGTPRG